MIFLEAHIARALLLLHQRPLFLPTCIFNCEPFVGVTFAIHVHTLQFILILLKSSRMAAT